MKKTLDLQNSRRVSELVRKLARRNRKRTLAHQQVSLSDNEVAQQIRSAGDSFLRSPEWKELRARALKLYGDANCMRCGVEFTKRRRPNVDHVKPRKLFPELALDINNLQVLCGRCNKKKANAFGLDYRDHIPPLPA